MSPHAVLFDFPRNQDGKHLCCVCAQNPATDSIRFDQRVTVKQFIFSSTYRDVWTTLHLCDTCKKKGEAPRNAATFTQGGLYLSFANRDYQKLFDQLNTAESLELKRIELRLGLIPALIKVEKASGQNPAALLREADQLIARMSMLGKRDLAEFHRHLIEKSQK